MSELIADLKQALLNPDEDFVVVNDPDLESGTKMVSDDEFEQIKRGISHKQTVNEFREEKPMRLKSDTEALYESDYESDAAQEEDDYDYDPRMEKVTTFLAVFAGVIILVILVILVIKVFGSSEGRPDNPNMGYHRHRRTVGEICRYAGCQGSERRGCQKNSCVRRSWYDCQLRGIGYD